jgi:hypothetical protein
MEDDPRNSCCKLFREQAVSRFFTDIDQHYVDKLGFESRIDKLNVEANKR